MCTLISYFWKKFFFSSQKWLNNLHNGVGWDSFLQYVMTLNLNVDAYKFYFKQNIQHSSTLK